MEPFFLDCIQYMLGTRDTLSLPKDFNLEKFQAYSRQHHIELMLTSLSSKGIIPLNLPNENTYPLILKHLRHKKCLLKVIEAFKAIAIPYVVLKGVPLNQQLYQHQCLRHAKDIDLLIPRRALTPAHQTLLALGFQLHSEFSPRQLQLQDPSIYCALKDLTYLHPTSQVEIELHWNTTITPQFGFNFSDIEAYRHLIAIENTNVYVLNHEYNFVYLCIHGSISHWRRLKWLMDVGVFTQRYSLSWKKVIDISKQYHAERCVLEASSLLRDFSYTLPTLPSKKSDQFAVFIHTCYIRHLWHSHPPPHPIIEQLIQLLLHRGLKQKFGFIKNRLFFNARQRKKRLATLSNC